MIEPMLNEAWVRKLLEWFDAGNRIMPWRNTKDPYKRWISEIMLQQTKVETVIPYYEKFMTCFPDIEALAAANEDDVLKQWEGLGYYSRARNLLKAARVIQEEHDGTFPESEKEALKLPGIGPYTAAAVLSMAYDIPLSSVDGNVMRVFSRIYELKENVLEPKMVKLVRTKLEGMIPKDRPGDFNESMMELGAVVCLPNNPRCIDCPIQSFCQAKKSGLEQELPVRIKKNNKKILEKHVFVVWNKKKDALLLKRNPSKGLLGGMWVFPTQESLESKEGLVQENNKGYNNENKESEEWDHLLTTMMMTRKIGRAKHIFSHQQWNMTIYEAETDSSDRTGYQWIQLSEIDKLAFPEVYQKVLRSISLDSADS